MSDEMMSSLSKTHDLSHTSCDATQKIKISLLNSQNMTQANLVISGVNNIF